MNMSAWGAFLLTLCLITLVTLGVIQIMTTTNENDYYLLRETVESALEDSVEPTSLTSSEGPRVNEDQFIKILTMRFAESADTNRKYKIRVTCFSPEPPMVCVEVSTTITNNKFLSDDTETKTVVNRINAILEQKVTTSQ